MTHDNTDTTPLRKTIAVLKRYVAAPRRILARANTRIDNALYGLSDRSARLVALEIVAASLLGLPVVAGPMMTRGVVAQSAADDAASAMCSTGLGSLVTYLLGFIAVVLILIAGLRGAIAWNNMGSARKDKKREGREQLKGAGITLTGAFFPPIFAVGLEQAGIATLSCVDFGNVLWIAPIMPV